MKLYECDCCHVRFVTNPKITVEGYTAKRGGGLILPRTEFHFCSEKCFLAFIKQDSTVEDK